MEREASCTDEEQTSGIGSRGVEIRGKQFRKEQIWLDRQPQNRGRTRAEQGQNKGRTRAEQGQNKGRTRADQGQIREEVEKLDMTKINRLDPPQREHHQ